MSALPSTSEVAVELDNRCYNSLSLVKLLEGPAGALKHCDDTILHTLSIHATLTAPEPEIEYYRRPSEPNPAYTSFIRLCDSVRARTADDGVRCRVGIQKMGSDPYVALSVASEPDEPRSAPLITFGGQRGGRKFSHGELGIGGGREWSSSTAWDMRNWLHAVLALDGNQPTTRLGTYRDGVKRFRLEAGIKLWCGGTGGVGDGAMNTDEINGLVTINLYADIPTLQVPPETEIASDLVGLILHSLIPYSHDTADSALSHFFSSMQPAPFFPAGEQASDLQPVAMTSQLLPFQLRTLRHLLQREASSFQGDSAKVAAASDPEGFWGEAKVENEAFGYRRLTGDVQILPGRRKGKGRAGQEQQLGEGVQAVLDLSGIKGTMLCEEMGLGKTVEAIALVLSHRHPLSSLRRSLHMLPPVVQPVNDRTDEDGIGEPLIPTINLFHGLSHDGDPEGKVWAHAEMEAFKDARTWDEASQLHVAEVGTTLIVTPPVLLKQWCAEIRTHAPALKVCVYEGWKTLQDGVRKKQDQLIRTTTAAAKAEQRAAEARKRKATAEKRKDIAKKYAKAGSKPRATTSKAMEHAYEDEDEIKQEEEEAGGKRAGPSKAASGSRGRTTKAEESAGMVPETKEDQAASTLEVTQREFERYVRAHDVVITTYQDLAKDLTVAHPAPARSRRKNVNYASNERPRSPLVMCKWWRVIMDEVQLSGDQSAASEMVALIPRRNSLAVSGTPVKTDIRDLLGVLRFLRVPTLPYSAKLWYRLQQPAFRPAFAGLVRSLGIRTTKAQVSSELLIPRQSRWVIPIELSQIEQHYYLDTLSRQRDIIRRSASATTTGGGLDRALLRSCLMDLRQICTHIQVGMMHPGGAAGGPAGPREGGVRMHLGRELMTMHEALAKMKRDHAGEFMLESRNQVRSMIRLGQLIVSDEERLDGLVESARAYDQARELTVLQLTSAREQLKSLLIEAGKGSIDGIDAASEELSTPERDKTQSQHERERAARITQARTAVRELLLVLHQGWFLLGDVRHQQGDEEAETNAYNTADEIRKEILDAPLRSSRAAIARLNLDKLADVSLQDLQTKDTKRKGGIVSTDTILSINELLMIMNENAQLVTGWRHKIIELLQSPVDAQPETEATDRPAARAASGASAASPNGSELTAPPGDRVEEEHYAKTVQFQADAQAYLTAYATALMDRKEMIKEERSLLVDVDAQRVTERATKRAREAREAAIEMGMHEGKGLLDELMQERQVFRDARAGVCERPLLAYLMTLGNISLVRRDEEVVIVNSAADMVRKYIKEQSAHFEELNKELDTLRGVFNHRVRYFAALQEISDSVSPLELPKKANLDTLINTCKTDIAGKELRLARLTTRGRYLDFLDAKQHDADEVRDDCLICMGSSDDTHGVLLDCGHFFCASCFKAYRSSAMRGCPSCRRDINETGITRFKIADAGPSEATDADKLQNLVDGAVGSSSSVDPKRAGTSLGGATEEEDDPALESTELREAEEQEFGRTRAEEAEKRQRDEEMKRIGMMDLQTRREVAHMDMMGEYGSKIDFLVKHLLYRRARQPEARHVVFSNWSDSLNIVARALRQNAIKFASFDSKQKTKDVVENFIKDKSITVFLLHAERESAGLTLTTCQNVHLLEPVLRHSFELQAIGRVDRLGQKNETTVYCYATRDTVESRILALGVRNGTSIYLKQDDPEAGSSGAGGNGQKQNFASAAGKGGDLGKGEANEEELLGLIL